MENDECRNPSELMSVVRIKRIGYFSKWRAHDEDLPFDIAVLEVDDLTQHPEVTGIVVGFQLGRTSSFLALEKQFVAFFVCSARRTDYNITSKKAMPKK